WTALATRSSDCSTRSSRADARARLNRLHSSKPCRHFWKNLCHRVLPVLMTSQHEGCQQRPLRNAAQRCGKSREEFRYCLLAAVSCWQPIRWTGSVILPGWTALLAQEPRADLQIDLRSGLNAARSSALNSSGCSQAAKCPPLSTSWK